MANYCNNTITIKGDLFTLKTILSILERESEDGLFQRLIGTKAGITKLEYESNSYNYNLEYWGCRSDVDVDFHYELVDDELKLYPDTPYSPPIPFCRTLCMTFGVDIHMFYYGMEDDFCGVTTLTKDGFINEEDYEYLDGLYVFNEMDLFWSEVESRMESHIEYCENYEVEEFIENNVNGVPTEVKDEIKEMFSQMLEDYKILN
jgi:hypothetical protein